MSIGVIVNTQENQLQIKKKAISFVLEILDNQNKAQKK